MTDPLVQRCVEIATLEGVTSAISTLAVSGGAVLVANKYSPMFRRSLGVSGKLALVVTPTAGAFFLMSELALFDAKRDPAKYGIGPDGSKIAPVKANGETEFVANVVSKLGPQHRFANWLYDHPFQSIAGMAVPVVGTIFYGQTGSGKEHLKLSQKVMHTRVYGQASILGLFFSLMLFRDYMGRYGYFMEDYEAEEEAQYTKNGALWEAEELIKEAGVLYGRKGGTSS